MGMSVPERRVIVVGGGAAGMMASIFAGKAGARVTLLERGEKLGKKVYITGKGRCNVTNDCTLDEFLHEVARNPRFLYSALSFFSPQDMMQLLEDAGCPVVVQRGRRVFPATEKASDVTRTLARLMQQSGVEVRYGSRVQALMTETTEDGALHATGVRLMDGTALPAERVILATGGCSYPLTGSDGSGYRLAQALGHTIVPQTPSLVPLVAAGKLCAGMQGLSLRNVGLRIVRVQDQKSVYEDFGEMLFAHFGLTGPMILSASAHMRQMAPGRYEVHLDLKPALNAEMLDKRLQNDFVKYSNKNFSNSLQDLLPSKMIAPIVSLSGIDPHKKVNELCKEERRELVRLLKDLKLTVKNFRPIAEAIVTSGGVKVEEVDGRSMESKLVKGLYFAGEMLDVDAYTGGFNLQIAFSTGRLAALSAGRA